MKNFYVQFKKGIFEKEVSGFSLLETIVAIAIMTVAVSGIMNLVYQGSVSSRLQTDQVTATYLAADTIEYIRSLRDTYWLENIGGNTFDDWVSSSPINSCEDGCIVDTRINNDFINSCEHECQPLDYDNETGLYGHGEGSPSRFTRKVEIVPIADSGSDVYEAEITATVSWQRGSDQNYQIQIKQYIFDYRKSNN